MTTTADAVRRRAGWLVGLAAAGLLVLSGCSDPQAEPGEASTEGPAEARQEAPRPEVHFQVEVTPGAESVAVSWSLTNNGDEPLLVVDRVPRASGGAVLYDPQVAYVVGGDDGLVQIASQLFPMPETDRMSWARLPRAGATELAPGASLERDLAVPVPLEHLSPWGDDIGFGPIELPDPVTSVQFCLGVVAGDPEPSWGLERDGDVVLLQHGDATASAQHVLCSDPAPSG